MRALGFAALAISTVVAGASVAAKTTWSSQQGWTGIERGWWYNSPQGSRLVPLAWLTALETKDSAEKFLSPDNIDRFRYLTAGPDELPIGFAIDRQDDTRLRRTHLRWRTDQSNTEPWVGLTCAACHTARIEYQGSEEIVDGAPGMGDFQLFVDDLNAALSATISQPDKWERFTHRVLPGAQYTTANLDLLRASFQELLDWQNKLAAADATPTRYGFARVDAFGHIFNKVALSLDAQMPGHNPPDAPVSYPYLWGLAQERRVQWNGSVSNMPINNPLGSGILDVGALGRNSGEVIGVFGEAYPVNGGSTFQTSIDLENLNSIETQLRKLQAPKWPTFFPDYDASAAREGGKLYTSMCAQCHVRPGIDSVPTKQGWGTEVMAYFIPRPDASAPIPIDTDDQMACNAFLWAAPSGVLKGATYKAQDPKTGKLETLRIAAFAPIGSMAPMVVQRTFLGSKWTMLAIAWQSLTNNVPRPKTSELSKIFNGPVGIVPISPVEPVDPRAVCHTAINDNLGYKARPLNGIWATAPYLHNGSVPNLWELLSAPQSRSSYFYLGSREYDPDKVGFLTASSNRNSFRFDTALPGNSNRGHVYGVDKLNNVQRRQLLEYLKSL